MTTLPLLCQVLETRAYLRGCFCLWKMYSCTLLLITIYSTKVQYCTDCVFSWKRRDFHIDFHVLSLHSLLIFPVPTTFHLSVRFLFTVPCVTKQCACCDIHLPEHNRHRQQKVLNKSKVGEEGNKVFFRCCWMSRKKEGKSVKSVTAWTSFVATPCLGHSLPTPTPLHIRGTHRCTPTSMAVHPLPLQAAGTSLEAFWACMGNCLLYHKGA